MKTKETKQFIRWCILGAIGCGLMAAGDWLLGCVPLQKTDTGLFNRACYLSGSYGLWRPVLTVGLGAIGGFLYYFVVKALNADIDEKYRKTRTIQFLCGIFTVAIALTIHTWVATMAWFTTYLGPRIRAEAALAAVTAYQDDMLPAILPMYVPMLLVFGIHFVMLLAGKTRYPKWMLAFHPVTWNLLLAAVPDIAQAMQMPVATWMSVMSQSSTNSAIMIWCIAAAVYETTEQIGIAPPPGFIHLQDIGGLIGIWRGALRRPTINKWDIRLPKQCGDTGRGPCHLPWRSRARSLSCPGR